MKENSDTQTSESNKNDVEIDLKEIFNILWDSKKLFIFIVSLFAISSVFYSLSLPNVYQSDAILSLVEKKDLSSTISNSGLASLAGINLNSDASDSNEAKALKKVTTLSFFTDNILPNIYLPNLMAFDSWDRATNKITYNENIFNSTNDSWVRNFESPGTQIPSAQESFNVFVNNHLRVSEDKDKGFIIIGIKHQSPHIAQTWTDLIVKELNYFFKTKDKIEAQAAMEYLNNQMIKTSFAEIKQVIAELLKENTQILTLIEVSDFYVFEYIDPPVVMEKKIGPSRSLICIFGTFLGLIISIVVVLFRSYITTKSKD